MGLEKRNSDDCLTSYEEEAATPTSAISSPEKPFPAAQAENSPVKQPSGLHDRDDESAYPLAKPPEAKWHHLFTFTMTHSHHVLLLLSALFSLLSGLIIPLMSTTLGSIFESISDYGAGHTDSSALFTTVAKLTKKLLWLGTATFVGNGAMCVCWMVFAETQAKNARMRVFEGIIVEKEIVWFDERGRRKGGVSAMVVACQTQIKELETAISYPFGIILQSLVTLTVSTIYALHSSWKLSVVLLICIPISFVFSFPLTRSLPHYIHTQNAHLASSSQIAHRTISNIATVKCMTGEFYEINSFSRSVKLAGAASTKLAKRTAAQMGLAQWLLLSIFVLGFGYGERLFTDAERAANAGDIMTAFWSCMMAVQQLQQIIPNMEILRKGRSAGAYLAALVNEIGTGEALGRKEELGFKLEKFGGRVEFRDVSFAYPSQPSHLALHNISLTIEPQVTTWIIGGSGSGKSTLANLILKAYVPQSGAITLDGYSLEHLDSKWLRNNITLVQQNSCLFNDSLYQNIVLGQKNISAHEACMALKLADGEDMLVRLRNYIHNMVGVGGRNLSGGQKQRVALARALLRDSPFLILDEAVNALDHQSRNRIINSVLESRKGKTTVIITHDISYIPLDNFIIFLENGRVAESGTRRDLESRKAGYYKRFLKSSQIYTEQCQAAHLHTPLNSLRLDSGLNTVSTGVDLDVTESILPSRVLVRMHQPHRRRMYAWVPEVPVAREFDFGLGFSKLYFLKTPIIARALNFLPYHMGSKSHRQITLQNIYSTIWPSIGVQHKILLVLGAIAALAHAAATPVFSYLLSKILIAFCRPEEKHANTNMWTIALILIAMADGVATFLVSYLFEAVGQEWVNTKKIEAFQCILQQPLEWFEIPENVVSRLTEDLEKCAEQMKALLGQLAAFGFVGCTMLFISVIWAFIQCRHLTCAVTLLVFTILVASRLLSMRVDIYEERCNQATADAGAILMEAVENIYTVKMLSLERYFRRRYQEKVLKIWDTGICRCAWGGGSFAMSESSILFTLAVIMYYGTFLVAKKGDELEPVLSVITMMAITISHIALIFNLIPQLSICRDTARRLLRLTRLPMSSHETSGILRPPNLQGQVTYKKVNFSYSSKPVLRDVGLSIPAKSPPLIITGPSGSGKSTLLKLLVRLHNTTSGSITIDDIPVSMIDVKHLRQTVALVPSSQGLFDGLSIFDNITYGILSSKYSENDVYAAAKLAGAHNFINALPDGYNTILRRATNAGSGDGEGGGSGCTLSGGQAQRIAIARAVVRKPKVILLDEPSRGLDVESEQIMWEGLRKLAEVDGITIVVVTHANVGSSGGILEGRRVLLQGGRVRNDRGWL
ncbi:P-loop containing nucleoside triphosphate hydrolase protein [Kalaharituber pfeilii]|nr:P-loop containing nucleoside triphosphate hydrolase protein [Kalaharituber pfeilii]